MQEFRLDVARLHLYGQSLRQSAPRSLFVQQSLQGNVCLCSGVAAFQLGFQYAFCIVYGGSDVAVFRSRHLRRRNVHLGVRLV